MNAKRVGDRAIPFSTRERILARESIYRSVSRIATRRNDPSIVSHVKESRD